MSTTWTENGYEMKNVNGVVMVNDHGTFYEFVEWIHVGDKVFPMININVR